jgi:hypothetical protein
MNVQNQEKGQDLDCIDFIIIFGSMILGTVISFQNGIFLSITSNPGLPVFNALITTFIVLCIMLPLMLIKRAVDCIFEKGECRKWK